MGNCKTLQEFHQLSTCSILNEQMLFNIYCTTTLSYSQLLKTLSKVKVKCNPIQLLEMHGWPALPSPDRIRRGTKMHLII